MRLKLTRKRLLVLISLLPEWHRFIHPVISMHTTLAASNPRQSSPFLTAVQRLGSHQTTEHELIFCPASLILFLWYIMFFSPLTGLLCCPETVFRWAFQGDRASIIQWVLVAPHFVPEQKTGISIRTCPPLRTWIMLSVHRHYRSWNDKANERRAGRWVQDPLSLNHLTSRLPVGMLLGGKCRFTAYRTGWDLNSLVTYKA